MMIQFEIRGEISEIETIAEGRGVYIRRYLERTYGKGRWRKMKGMATVQLVVDHREGEVCHSGPKHGGGEEFRFTHVRNACLAT